MKLFLDSANPQEISRAASWGVISGVTTNPTLAAKVGGFATYRALVQEIRELLAGPISVEVVRQGVEAMVEQGKEISSWAPDLVVKIPATAEGVEATQALAAEGIAVNFTLCFSLNQALLGALAGARYISPFVGRLDDVGEDGIALVADMVNMVGYYEFPVEVIAASIRHPAHVAAAVKAGAHIATVPWAVLSKLMEHPLTAVGLENFLADFRRSGLYFA